MKEAAPDIVKEMSQSIARRARWKSSNSFFRWHDDIIPKLSLDSVKAQTKILYFKKEEKRIVFPSQ